ncbi:MAG TPA: DMT family transporter [Bacteroidia bacterium]|nr:DMT family transporter [Bacteroidia bacterium]
MKSRSFLHWIIFLALALTWGSSFILMKRGLDVFTGFQVGALRISIAFLFLLPLAVKHLKPGVRKHWKAGAAMGLCGNLFPAFLFAKAETMISSSLTGMMNSLTPLFTMVVGLFVFRSKVGKMQVAGVVIGLAGAIGLLQLGEQETTHSNALTGTGMVLLATLFYGISVNIIKAKLAHLNAVAITVLALCMTGPFAIAYLFTTDFFTRISTVPGAAESIAYIAVLAILGTSLSVMVYNILIKEAGTLFAASVTYLIPVVALGWGMLDGEKVGWLHGALILVILAGVWMINKKQVARITEVQ